jgi:hypothetical protein
MKEFKSKTLIGLEDFSDDKYSIYRLARIENGKNAALSGQFYEAMSKGGKAVVDKLNEKNKKSNHWRKLGDSKIGVARTEETKEKIQKASAHSWRTILQFTKDGEFIREWKNLASIKEELGFHHTNICACCQNKPKYKTSYGFIWKYKDEKHLDMSN